MIQPDIAWERGRRGGQLQASGWAVSNRTKILRLKRFPQPILDTCDGTIDRPLGKKLDGYQWVLFISAHSERHTKQINEVKADPGFPKK